MVGRTGEWMVALKVDSLDSEQVARMVLKKDAYLAVQLEGMKVVW